MFGGMTPYPRKMGGGRPRVHDILDSLNSDMGDTYAANDTSTTIYCENISYARALSAGWGTNIRLGNMWDAERMPKDAVVRWERILNIVPKTTDSWAFRRYLVKLKIQTPAKALPGYLIDLLQRNLGSSFVALEHIPLANAQIFVPDGTYPFGSVGPVPWSSTVAHLLIKLQKPAGWTEGEFYEAAAKVHILLDPILPADVTFDWYRAGATSVAITDGPSAAGFYLDEDNNLDNQILDT